MESLIATDAVDVHSHLAPGDEPTLADDVLDGLTRPFEELPPMPASRPTSPAAKRTATPPHTT